MHSFFSLRLPVLVCCIALVASAGCSSDETTSPPSEQAAASGLTVYYAGSQRIAATVIDGEVFGAVSVGIADSAAFRVELNWVAGAGEDRTWDAILDVSAAQLTMVGPIRMRSA
ncbi:MAG: hypothetical protein R3E97_16840 [Candidatus Eisenbacteria bacterium]